MKTGLIVICSLAAVAAAFLIGLNFGYRRGRSAGELGDNGIQTDLLVNRILEERKLQSMLSKGCVVETEDALSINLDQDTKLLAEFFNGKLGPDARKYIVDRYPGPIGALETFKSKYGNSWTEMECNK